MGSGITVDKRTTSLEDWLQIHQHLQQTNFQSQIQNHIVLWKLLPQESQSSQIISIPLTLDIYSSQNIFHPNQAYILLAIKNNHTLSAINKDAPPNLLSILYSIQQNIQQQTYMTQIVKVKSPNNNISYAIYTYFGKFISNKMQMAALSYAFKLNDSLSYKQNDQVNPQNTQKKLAILSAGGYIKNKKLQAGSTMPLCKQESNSANRDLIKFQKIGLYGFFLQNKNMNKRMSIFDYKPKQKIVKIQRDSRSISDQSKKNTSNQSVNSSINNSYAQKNSNKIQQENNIVSNGKFNLNLKGISKLPISNTAAIAHNNESQSQNQNNSINALSQRQFKQNSKVPGIKPPMLKLTLKPYEQVTYDQISDQFQNGIKFDIRATARHELKMEKFSQQCNQIVQGLFVSGQKCAKDYSILKKHNITQVINCAGDYCQNWHQDKNIKYLTFFLKDSPNENIQCLFYRSIDFIQNAHKNKKNVLVHCIQGISRSITLCIAYIIFTHGLDYKKAQHLIKSKRGIASPNNGFMVQLIQFHKRLYQDVSLLPLPRVFLVSSHSKQTPSIITARMIKQPLFDPKKYIGLDARAIYIIQTLDIIYLWVGSKCDESRLTKYWAYAQDYIKRLQRYQRGPQQVKAISQGSQGIQFYSIWGLTQIPPLFQNQQYSRLFHEGDTAKPGYIRKFYERQQQKSVSKRLFIFGDSENGLGVFDMDDLSGLSILVNSQEQKLKVYIYKQQDYEIKQQQQSQFLDKIIKQHYSQFDPQAIIISEQNGSNFSQNFMNEFS